MSGTLRQLVGLMHLRWQMLRSPGMRVAMIGGAGVLAYVLAAVVRTAPGLDGALLATAIQVAPSAYLGFGFLAMIAPLTAGGGNELVPPDQLQAYPVRPSTQFMGGLVLAPLNLVWVLQLVILVALTAYLTLGGSFLRGVLTTGAYVVAITVLGQAAAWTVVGLRQTATGRRVVTGLGLSAAVAVVFLVRSGRGQAALDLSPTRQVVRAVISGGVAARADWVLATGALLVLACFGLLLGNRACRWALGRPGDDGAHRRTEPVRRRALRGGPLRELVAVDRASVWRAPALRRGGLVLLLLPGLLGAVAAVPWTSLVVLPGLVAAGAALLFGVNAFCLDGSGSLWLASLPHDPALALRAKTIVLTETVLAAVVVSAFAGSLRSPGTPTAAELGAIVTSGLACTAVVVAISLKASVRHPHRAELRGPRDAVAPPGALVLASARLAVPTAVVGILLGSAAETGVWWLPLAMGLPVVLLCGLSVNRSALRWADPVQRARVVQTVAAG